MFIYLTLLSGYSPLVMGNCVLSGTCQKLAGGEGGGVETEGGSQLFETAEKGGVIKNEPLKGGGSCKYANMCP